MSDELLQVCFTQGRQLIAKQQKCFTDFLLFIRKIKILLFPSIGYKLSLILI